MKYCSNCAAPVARRVPPGDSLPRWVCDQCGMIHYQNPLMVVGAIPEHAGRILLCCASPLTDVEIEYVPVQVPKPAAAKTYRARVAELSLLAPDVMRIVLEVEGGVPAFYAGQYINILLDDGERRSFSFANPPHESGAIELHIRHIPNGRYTTHVFSAMKVGDSVRFEGPLGAFFLRTESELVLKSRRVVPGRLLRSGFTFRFPAWPEAAADLCRRWRRGAVRRPELA